MTSNVTNELIFEHLRKIQSDLSEVRQMRGEMREGFAAIRQHMAAQHNDVTLLEYRLLAIESEVERIKSRLELRD